MDLAHLLERTVAGLGYELVDLERSNRGRLLRVFIDRPGGIGVEDCAAVSNHLTRVLAVEAVDYDRLEVSSPGLDRVLRGERDLVRFTGEKARVKLRIPRNGQRNFVGTLRGVEGGALKLEVDSDILEFELPNIEKARLVPNI